MAGRARSRRAEVRSQRAEDRRRRTDDRRGTAALERGTTAALGRWTRLRSPSYAAAPITGFPFHADMQGDGFDYLVLCDRPQQKKTAGFNLH